MKNQLVIILDFGGQYNQLIARRVREHSVYCEVLPYTAPVSEIKAKSPIGIILTGGPASASAFGEGSPRLAPELLELGIPVLGLCYGAQALVVAAGGEVKAAPLREFGRTAVEFSDSPLFSGLPKSGFVWMSHNDYISRLPSGFVATAVTPSCPVAAMENAERRLYGMQFHPEVNHTEHGSDMLRAFLYNVCGALGDWTMGDYAAAEVEHIKQQVGDGRVLLALSGGVDSSVCASLLERAVGERLTCIFVDTGLMRKNEGDEVQRAFSSTKLHLIRVNAKERFLARLAGVTDPETKRKIIGEEFIRVFEAEAKKIGRVDFLAQGTIYPDVIESGVGDAAVIKSHHNVGGLPDYVDFKEIIEPLRPLFKDEVRALGRELALPDYLVMRQPFPGPGLGIRVIGEVCEEKLAILREADYIFREEIAKAGLAGSISQYFAVMTDMRSVGVMGDGRTYDYTLALRGVTTTDFMTADFARIPYDVLEAASVRIVNEVGCINRIVYDITSKPPATIEWE